MIELALIGTPNSGKSTFFKACTLKDVKIADYPFTTLDPNEGLAHVSAKCPCKELNLQCKNCRNGTRFVPVRLWDVAGLVEGAHLGRGHGNAFLNDLMQAAAFIHVIDVSGKTDLEGNPADNFDPLKAVAMLDDELDFWLLGLIKKDWNAAKSQRNTVELFTKRLSGLGVTREHIKIAMERLHLSDKIENWSDRNGFDFVSLLRSESKPSVIAANKFDLGGRDNLEKLEQRFGEKKIFPTSAEFELALREAAKHGLIEYLPGSSSFAVRGDLNDRQKAALEKIKAFLEKNRSTNVQHVLNETVFNVLGMIAVYPVENEARFSNKKGDILPDCLLMKKGSTALDMAFQIHQDIGKKFISAVNARTKRTVSADYRLQHGDIISIKSGH